MKKKIISCVIKIIKNVSWCFGIRIYDEKCVSTMTMIFLRTFKV